MGLMLLDKIETDIRIDEVDKPTQEAHNKFSKEQPANTKIMESAIQEIIVGYCGAWPVLGANTNAVGRLVDAVDSLPEHPNNKEEEQEDTECPWCSGSLFVLIPNKNTMVAWNESK